MTTGELAQQGYLSGFDLEFEDMQRLATLLDERKHAAAGNLWGSSQAFVLAALARRPQAPALLAIASTEAEADALRDDIESLGIEATSFPARETFSSNGRVHADVDVIRARLQLAQLLIATDGPKPRVLVASLLALLQPIPSLRDLEKEFFTFRSGELLDVEHLLRHLVKLGYARQPLAETPGELSLRGDILDIFPFASQLPIRIELFEDEIESVRTFEPETQRSIDSVKELEVCLASENADIEGGEGIQITELLASETVFVHLEPLRVEEQAESLRIQSPAYERALRTHRQHAAEHAGLHLQSLPADDINFETRSTQALELGMAHAVDGLRQATADGTQVVVLCQTQPEVQRFEEVLAESGGVPGVRACVGSLTRGFRLPACRLVVVHHRELKGLNRAARRQQRGKQTHRTQAIQTFFELKPGDLVVHAVHGLARFVGLERMARGGGEEEHLHLEFADEVSLYVPSGRIDLVQRYIGSGSGSLPLDRIGGTAFKRRKERVQRGLFDLAAELIEIQAKRALRDRPPWHGDQALVKEMVGSFPYEDTDDQRTVYKELGGDLSGERPMDRLICGDVGFGKTEMAVRAAYHVVAGGGQVAVLVPTTILAQQHYQTFVERLSDFAARVEVISRYVSSKDTKAIIAATADGEVDVLIGTHRILSKDVTFKRLGLVVIDEEQRFGVTHKEHFKKLRANVDMLTMTATPIPRTLHMSLSGIRDISALTIAPPGRQTIETVLCYADEDQEIQNAILREKNRGGQVFFLHNRVSSIGAVAERISKLAPGCTIATGHGQMHARDLQEIMDAFTRGEADVLVATTIIENGLDIPAAGTILIDQADRFGLSELHQLRGRVGRGDHKAFCYLLVDRHKPLRQIARDRLKALEELNHLGAGFSISVKDLELRGAGNILGAEQSGHIAAVGYDMFCRLLRVTIERLQAGEIFDKETTLHLEEEEGVELELGLAAFLPEIWIPKEETRLELLRQLAEVREHGAAKKAEGMLRDRFGRVPEEARNLIRMFRLRGQLDPFHLKRLAWREDAYLVEYNDRVALEHLFGGLDVELRHIKKGIAHLVIPPARKTPMDALKWFERLLKDVAKR